MRSVLRQKHVHTVIREYVLLHLLQSDNTGGITIDGRERVYREITLIV